jgi:hypothetical protein
MSTSLVEPVTTTYNRAMRFRFRKALEFAVENSLLMVLGTVIALIWATSIQRATTPPSTLCIWPSMTSALVFFFGLAVKEIEATAPFTKRSRCSRAACSAAALYATTSSRLAWLRSKSSPNAVHV